MGIAVKFNHSSHCPLCGTGRMFRADTCMKCGYSYVTTVFEDAVRDDRRVTADHQSHVIRFAEHLTERSIELLRKVGMA